MLGFRKSLVLGDSKKNTALVYPRVVIRDSLTIIEAEIDKTPDISPEL
jgi:hypothetical protein